MLAAIIKRPPAHTPNLLSDNNSVQKPNGQVGMGGGVLGSASPLLELPEHIWSQVIFNSITDIRDRVSACLACRRFWGYWAKGVAQQLQGRQVVLDAGRFVQQWEGDNGPVALQFQLETRGPRFEWLHLLDRFLARSVPSRFTYISYLQLPRAVTECCSSRNVAKTGQQHQLATATPSARAQPAPPCAADVPQAASTGQSSAEPGVWVTLPPSFQRNLQPPVTASAGGYCVGHLHKSTGISICLLMSGTANSYCFELPCLQLVLSVDRAARIAEARLQLCQIRPVLRPGLCARRT